MEKKLIQNLHFFTILDTVRVSGHSYMSECRLYYLGLQLRSLQQTSQTLYFFLFLHKGKLCLWYWGLLGGRQKLLMLQMSFGKE